MRLLRALNGFERAVKIRKKTIILFAIAILAYLVAPIYGAAIFFVAVVFELLAWISFFQNSKNKKDDIGKKG
ncbi:hypothetical protein [Aeromonas fluvialis]|uniref:hypothetical protein n=1 Tax=Aeromonas fluvialis TaxID=591962 RepID=UPI0005A9A41B|nr:hypothetical protein [Aeromonas fluvialis]